MTVICSWCMDTIEEKCPKCGARCLTYWNAPTEGPSREREHRAICPSCRAATFELLALDQPQFEFAVGEGGVSHGICPACFEVQMDELKAGVRAGAGAGIPDSRFQIQDWARLEGPHTRI
jgi:hypothetical protein